jgi:hypothetical protein
MNENNGTPGFVPRGQTQRTMGVVRALSAALTVLDNHHPPLNVRVVSEALRLFLDGQGLAYLMLEDANVVAVGAVADHDAVHADFRGVAAVTIGEVFEGDDDPEISFGTAAPTSAVTAPKMREFMGGGAPQLFLDLHHHVCLDDPGLHQSAVVMNRLVGGCNRRLVY